MDGNKADITSNLSIHDYLHENILLTANIGSKWVWLSIIYNKLVWPVWW